MRKRLTDIGAFYVPDISQFHVDDAADVEFGSEAKFDARVRRFSGQQGHPIRTKSFEPATVKPS
jgi:hypothetical protein